MAKKAKKIPENQIGLFSEEAMFPITELDAARNSALKCTKCRLCEKRTKVVFGVGNVVRPDLMLIGEGPGAKEDLAGEPFVGPAGKYLDKMISSIGYKRPEVYMCNVVCCRPTDSKGQNRPPTLREVAQCADYLVRQIRVVNPRVIVLLGKTAAEATLQKTFKSIEGVRKTWYDWDKIPVRVTYHPSYLLRTKGEKTLEAQEDLKAIRAKVRQLKLKET